jgi:hypothetical protein
MLPLRLLRLARAVGAEPAPEQLALAVLAGFSGPRQAEHVLMIGGATIVARRSRRGEIYRNRDLLVFEVDLPESSPGLALPRARKWSGEPSVGVSVAPATHSPAPAVPDSDPPDRGAWSGAGRDCPCVST